MKKHSKTAHSLAIPAEMWYTYDTIFFKEKLKMKFCCCINLNALDRLEKLHELGYTCYETGLAALENAAEEDIAKLAAKAEELGMPCVSHNGMFPPSVTLLRGPESYPEITAYMEKVFSKAKPLGAKVIILGSGGARKIPDGMTKEEATERFIALCRDCISPCAEKYGLTIGIEELRAAECNFINSCKEAMEIIRAVNKPNIQLLVDYFHAALGGDTNEEIASYGDAIAHVHIASPKRNRAWPNEEDFEDVKGFFAALKAAGYDGPVSLEGSCVGDLTECLTTAIDVMQRAL